MTTVKRIFLIVSVAMLAGCAAYQSPQQFSSATQATVAEAIKHYSQRYQENPSDLTALVGLSRNLRYAGEAERALEILATAPESAKNRPALLAEKGKAYLAGGQYETAKEILEYAVARDEEAWDAWSALGITFDFLRDYGHAAISYTEAAKLCPESASILNNLALSTALSGDLPAAKAMLVEASSLRPHSTQIRNNLTLVTRIERQCPRCRAKEIIRRMGAMVTAPDWSHGDLACTVGQGEIVETLSHADYIDMKVEFAFDSADLTPVAMATLDRLGAALTAPGLKNIGFTLEGHTDAVGTQSYNEDLSSRRAEAVKNYLTGVLGLDPARLETVGYGETRLLDPVNPQSGVNRRVRVTRQK